MHMRMCFMNEYEHGHGLDHSQPVNGDNPEVNLSEHS